MLPLSKLALMSSLATVGFLFEILWRLLYTQDKGVSSAGKIDSSSPLSASSSVAIIRVTTSTVLGPPGYRMGRFNSIQSGFRTLGRHRSYKISQPNQTHALLGRNLARPVLYWLYG
jgi:hypothetical protein